MKLNHLNLTVPNVQETSQFLAKYFGLRPGGGNHIIAFLSDDDGMALTLTSTAPGDERAVHYPTNFHIGFAQSGADAVNALHQRLKADGYNVPEPSRQHGSWTFYFEAPGGFTIEVLS